MAKESLVSSADSGVRTTIEDFDEGDLCTGVPVPAINRRGGEVGAVARIRQGLAVASDPRRLGDAAENADEEELCGRLIIPLHVRHAHFPLRASSLVNRPLVDSGEPVLSPSARRDAIVLVELVSSRIRPPIRTRVTIESQWIRGKLSDPLLEFAKGENRASAHIDRHSIQISEVIRNSGSARNRTFQRRLIILERIPITARRQVDRANGRGGWIERGVRG